MAVNIVTGMTGIEHITSHDDRARNASQFGRGKYVFDIGRKFSATAVDDNLVRIQDGMCINQGTQMGIEPNDYADVEIDNGLLGTNRHDIIVMRYEKNEETLLEKASLAVVKGVNSSEPVDPDITEGNILDGGDLVDDMPLYRVVIEGVNLVSVEPLFEVFDGDVGSILEELGDKVDKVAGKGLSTNDYTNEDKAKVDGIPTKTSDLQNDSNFVSDADYVHTDNNYTNADKEDVAKIGNLEHSLSTTKTATGNPISVSDSAHTNAEGLTVELEPIQSGSGTPSPENVRPISGYDSTSIVRSGKNKCESYVATALTKQYVIALYIETDLQASTTYAISFDDIAGNRFYANENVFTEDIAITTVNGRNSIVVTTKDNLAKNYLTHENGKGWIILKNQSAQSITPDISKVQIELGSTATTYEPYTADTYTLQFGDTVYGAEVDFVNGVATVTKGYIAEYAGETLPSTWISDRDVYASGTVPTTGAEVAYELATPTTIQLTPQQIKMLKGNNVLTADGDMNLTYQTDSVVGDVKEWAENEFLSKNSATAQHNYSTQEQVVGTWIDGKTLYEKTVYGTYQHNVPVTIATNVDTAFVVNQYYEKSGVKVSPFYGTINMYIRVNSDNTLIINNSEQNPITWTVTVRYTKTTV